MASVWQSRTDFDVFLHLVSTQIWTRHIQARYVAYRQGLRHSQAGRYLGMTHTNPCDMSE